MSKSVDVAIVGAGPIGTLIGNLLGCRGISTCIIEKQSKPYNLPRAVHFDGEAMRVFQSAGLVEDILPSTRVNCGMLFQDMDGKTLIDWSRDQQIGPTGWYESYRFHQPGLEAALLAGLDRFPQVELHRGTAVEHIRQDDSEAILTLNNGQEISTKFVIGCDGATSLVRDLLNIEVDDLGYKERWLVVDLMLKNPRDDLGDYSIQYCDEENPATYVRGVGDRRRWEMRLKPRDPDSLSDELVWQRLQRWITPHDATLERSAGYTFRSSIAKQWRNGRCFLAGDAAHQMPPFMGQGMCAGIRDAANLVWKLDHDLRGADNSLLDTYFSERERNVRQFIELTVRLGKLINQTAAGNAPSGSMKSIWPSLGPGFGKRDGVGGELAPQIRLGDDTLADDFADHGFYILSTHPLDAPLPVVVGQWDKLDEFGFKAALVRPDGYAAFGFNDPEELQRSLHGVQLKAN